MKGMAFGITEEKYWNGEYSLFVAWQQLADFGWWHYIGNLMTVLVITTVIAGNLVSINLLIYWSEHFLVIVMVLLYLLLLLVLVVLL